MNLANIIRSSPYSASKAASDHLVYSWNRTYELPTIITNCTNNYGPFQHNEKFIPSVITSALKNKPIRIYGDGNQIRDWLYVDDHVNALILIMKSELLEKHIISPLALKLKILI